MKLNLDSRGYECMFIETSMQFKVHSLVMALAEQSQFSADTSPFVSSTQTFFSFIMCFATEHGKQ